MQLFAIKHLLDLVSFAYIFQVIQDISFSVDSNWIMISSSRGTNHLFAINPLGGSINLPSADASFTGKSNGLGGTTRSAIHWLPNSNPQMPNHQSTPVTLSAVSRIRNGNNSWRGTVSGAAAAATGRVSPLSGAVASSFHNCKGKASYLDCSSSKAKYHLLVFSPSGCMIQYALRISTGLDSMAAVSGLNAAYESGLEYDARLVVEANQKWNICQKQNRRETEDNIDIYGDNGSADSNKIYPEGAKKGKTVFPEVRGPGTKGKITPEDDHHLYIAEAELQMHEARNPLWAKPEVYIFGFEIRLCDWHAHAHAHMCELFHMLYIKPFVFICLLDIFSVYGDGGHEHGSRNRFGWGKLRLKGFRLV